MNKKYLSVLVIGWLMTISLASVNAGINPNMDGYINDLPEQIISPVTLYVGGTGPGNYTNIQDAIDNANSHDTVFVYSRPDNYHEDIKIYKTINLIGEDKETTRIIATTDCKDECIEIYTDYVTISEFNLTVGEAGDNSGGILIHTSNYVHINNCNIAGLEDGIYLFNSSHNEISYCSIIDTAGEGIFLCYSDYNEIHHCYIKVYELGISTGIDIYLDSSNNIIHHNTLCNTNLYTMNAENSDAQLCENNKWDDGSEGNYWDDYPGIFFPNIFDQDGDGIGDEPYTYIRDGLDGFSDCKDNFPLMDAPVGDSLINSEQVSSFQSQSSESNSQIQLFTSISSNEMSVANNNLN